MEGKQQNIIAKLFHARKLHHRLMRERKLTTVRQAEAFVKEVGLATLTPSSGLPSIFGAVLGGPFKPGSRGFGNWPANEWWWGGELAKTRGILSEKILRGKGVFVAERLWDRVAPIARSIVHDLQLGKYSSYGLSSDARRIFGYLRDNGPTRTDLLRRALGYETPEMGRRFHRAKLDLESLGVIVGREAKMKTHLHVDTLHLWTHLFPRKGAGLTRTEGEAELFYSALDAAVIAAEKTAMQWFEPAFMNAEMVLNSLLESGRVVRLNLDQQMLTTDRWIARIGRG